MSRLLDKLTNPSDLRAYSYHELNILAKEIREEILYTVSLNGGHLAPNLGVVELTLAVHRVFESPKDKLVWDVGHQCYTHKLLTGRRDAFFSLRQLDGISGFPKPEESIHDAFATGHSSTSISAALGMATSRDLSNEDYKVVAIIGDGSITGGMAYEGLNHAGHLKSDLTVILNDNEMSIAQNVGALSRYLSDLRAAPSYSKFKSNVQNALDRVPLVGKPLAKVIEKTKNMFKYMLVPGVFFEELGFTYLGPIDGHNIQQMCKVFSEAAAIKGPVLVHVITKKGKGYIPAEESPSKFHGVGPFDIETGKSKAESKTTFTSCFAKALLDEASQNEDIVGITAAMTEGTGLLEFSRKYPERFFDVAIAEQHAVTFAAGLAARGKRPVVAIYSTFLQRAYDQIIHDVCLSNLPVVFAIDRAGLVGSDGPTHHGIFDLSFLRTVPNLVLFSPKDGTEVADMLHTAFQLDCPVAIRYPKQETAMVFPRNRRYITPGKAEVLSRGRHVNIVAEGIMVDLALKVQSELAKESFDIGVVNIRSIKPLDETLLCSLADQPLVCLENNTLDGGLGSAVLEALNRNGISAKVKCIGLPNSFIPSGSISDLNQYLGLDLESVTESIKQFLGLMRIVPEVASK
ncbi:MAG: 1-deoxy-D-xylulose-5-phosphate synthase [Firmicutes bacterium]|nr:1-deoxy-D-xylulose-5-phosphate synthase [Bacillota bacterium]MDD4693916.1 1-deoxy-D-xylulose-5-phosphate synthase [Bacillota bacterium]